MSPPGRIFCVCLYQTDHSELHGHVVLPLRGHLDLHLAGGTAPCRPLANPKMSLFFHPTSHRLRACVADLRFVSHLCACLMWRCGRRCTPALPHTVGTPRWRGCTALNSARKSSDYVIFTGRGCLAIFRRAHFCVTRFAQPPQGGVSAWRGAGTASFPPGRRLDVNGKGVENAIPTRHASTPEDLFFCLYVPPGRSISLT